MSATTHTTPASSLSAAGILNSEWIKLRSVRSPAWSFAIAILVTVGFAALLSIPLGDETVMDTSDAAAALGNYATIGVQFSQIVVAVLGVLVITGEYSTGMIRSTLSAVPGRFGALAGKGVVLFLTTFVVSVVASIFAFGVSSAMFVSRDVSASILDEKVALPILGGALYLALLSLFALGIGTILRSGAGGIATVLGVLLLLPVLLAFIPFDWAAEVAPFLFSNAGIAFWHPESSDWEWWQNLLVTIGWVVASLGIGAALLRRRDA